MANLLKYGFGRQAIKLHFSPPFSCRSFSMAFSQRRLCSSKQQHLRSDVPANAKDAGRVCPPPCCPSPQPPCPPPSNKGKYIGLGLLGLLGGSILAYWMYKEEPKKAELPRRRRVPASSQDIPKEVPYLLIGGGTASFSAFRAIKSNDPKAKVMVITSEIEMPYMRPPLSKELWLSVDSETDTPEKLQFKQWNGVERSVFYEPDDFYIDPVKLMDEPNGGVAIVRGFTVKYIDVCRKMAVLTDGTEIKYNECLLATGSTPKNLDVFSSASLKIKNNISLFKTIEDFEQLKTIIKKSGSIAVVGGGFLGSELSCALAKYGETNKKEIYQLFHENGNMGKILPEYLSEWTTERIRDQGVIVMPQVQIETVDTFGTNQLKLNLSNGNSLIVDHVIVAVGSEPNIQLAKASGLEVDSRLGGYVVNAELEARRHVYVAGDAACFYDPKLGRRRVEHHDHAVVSGRLAGENMVGMKKPYKHQSMFWSDLGPKVGYEAIGIVDAALPTVGVFAKATNVDSPAGSGINHLDISSDQNIPQLLSSTQSEKSNKLKPMENQEIKSSTFENTDNYGKGIIFYLRNDIVVGIVLWNVFNRINIARAVVSEGKKYEDLNEVAKLFGIHT